MGTDRYVIYRDRCLCGQGEFVIEESMPDHPFAKRSQRSHDAYIECECCDKQYILIKQRDHIMPVLKKEYEEQKQSEKECQERKEILMVQDEIQQIIKKFEKHLESLPSKKAIHELLSNLGFHTQTYPTFCRHWQGAKQWVKRNITSTNIERITEELGETLSPEIDNKISLIKDLEKHARAELTPVSEPLLDTKKRKY